MLLAFIFMVSIMVFSSCSTTTTTQVEMSSGQDTTFSDVIATSDGDSLIADDYRLSSEHGNSTEETIASSSQTTTTTTDDFGSGTNEDEITKIATLADFDKQSGNDTTTKEPIALSSNASVIKTNLNSTDETITTDNFDISNNQSSNRCPEITELIVTHYGPGGRSIVSWTLSGDWTDDEIESRLTLTPHFDINNESISNNTIAISNVPKFIEIDYCLNLKWKHCQICRCQRTTKRIGAQNGSIALIVTLTVLVTITIIAVVIKRCRGKRLEKKKESDEVADSEAANEMVNLNKRPVIRFTRTKPL